MATDFDTSDVMVPGREFGDYEVVEEIGRGSMGSVYKVRSKKVPRHFALKLIQVPGGDAENESIERARAEVMALARFHHPHIVGLVDAFSVSGRRIAIVMDYLEGRPLDQLERELSAAQFMLVFRQIASALDVVHRENVIHRDIKPSNILVTWSLSNVEPHSYLIDFGITSGVAKAPELTTGFIGSPAFASPEQVGGDDVTAATDRFSLGAVAYEAITGVAPFEADSIVASLHKHVGWERPDLTPFYDVEFPAPFCRLVASLLEPDPADRPDSMRSVVDEVDQIIGLSDVLEGSEVTSESSVVSDASESSESSETAAVTVGKIGQVPSAARPADSESSRPAPNRELDAEDDPGRPQPTAAQPVGQSSSDATVEVSSDGRDRIWIDDGVVFLQREYDPEPEIVDTGGLDATAAAIIPGGLAFAVETNEVHVMEETGARRIIRFDAEISRLTWSDLRGALVAQMSNGEEIVAEL